MMISLQKLAIPFIQIFVAVNIGTGEFTKRVREKLSQLFVSLYTLSIYYSAHPAHPQLSRHLPNPFCEFPCSKRTKYVK